MNAKQLDEFIAGTIDVVKKSLEPRDVHLRSLEQRLTELGERNRALSQQVLDLTSLVHLLHDAGKVDAR